MAALDGYCQHNDWLMERQKDLDDVKTFFQHYHYKTELVDICRQRHLPTHGTKAELCARLLASMTGQSECKTGSSPQQQHVTTKITLETPLTAFAFTETARSFFAAYFNVQHFHFTKTMAILRRQARSNPSLGLTVADLIEVYKNTQSKSSRDAFLARTTDEQSYEWNHFVHDFFKDPSTKQYQQRLKVAAVLWQIVKRSAKPKCYSPELLIAHHQDLVAFEHHGLRG